MSRPPSACRYLAPLAVVAIHAFALLALWHLRSDSPPVAEPPLFAQLIELRPPAPAAPRAPRPVPVSPPRPVAEHRAVLAATSETAPAPVVAVAAAVEPRVHSAPPEPAAAAAPSGPLSLAGELAVACRERPPPDYPAVSRRMGEQGRAVIRVVLDAEGRVEDARLVTGSGSERLDAAALAAVRRWRCQPGQRDGRPVPTIALQPFVFVLRDL